MTYRIHQFDGVLLPEYIQRGDRQDIGTGAALTDYLSLPGGGWYDNFRRKKSPQGIRPITKTCLLWGDSAADARQKLDALRQRIGVPGRLTVAYDDGELRWQWARLQDVSAPRPSEAKGNWLPLDLTWITAAQYWFGTHQGNNWVWGDGSWVFGDGSAVMGQNAYITTFASASSPQTVTVDHVGNIDATNLVIEYTVVGSTLSTLALLNRATGQKISVGTSIGTGQKVRIDTGDQSARLLETVKVISSVSRDGNTLTVTTSTTHGFSDGNDVLIEGTESYDGYYEDVDSTGTNTFTVSVGADVHAWGTETPSAATVRRYTDIYDDLTLSDPMYWMVLAPGDNVIQVTGTDLNNDILSLEFYDHYA